MAWYNGRVNYELAKELKDAGFPFQLLFSGSNSRNSASNEYREVFATDEIWYLMPTFEELIEACGKPIWIEGYDHKDFQWLAGQGKGMDTPLGRGSTPTEAVARLWLALNKK